MSSRTFTLTPEAGKEFEIALPFDPREAFGRTRAPVVVEINGYSYRSTVTTMGGGFWIPFRRSHREAAALVEGEPVEITVTLDTEPRVVEAPGDLREALQAAGAWDHWQKLSFTHQREHVEAIEGAKKPDTRARRIERCIEALASAAQR